MTKMEASDRLHEVAKAACDIFDGFDPEIRKIIQEYPFYLSAEPLKCEIERIGIDAAKRWLRNQIQPDIVRMAIADFGPDHPQATGEIQ